MLGKLVETSHGLCSEERFIFQNFLDVLEWPMRFSSLYWFPLSYIFHYTHSKILIPYMSHAHQRDIFMLENKEIICWTGISTSNVSLSYVTFLCSNICIKHIFFLKNVCYSFFTNLLILIEQYYLVSCKVK